MSSMAQKIDEDNQNLMKKNQELKIQFLTQADDKELLMKQILYYKKEGQKIRTEYEQLKAKVDEHKRIEKNNEEMLGQNFQVGGKQRPVLSGVGRNL